VHLDVRDTYNLTHLIMKRTYNGESYHEKAMNHLRMEWFFKILAK